MRRRRGQSDSGHADLSPRRRGRSALVGGAIGLGFALLLAIIGSGEEGTTRRPTLNEMADSGCDSYALRNHLSARRAARHAAEDVLLQRVADGGSSQDVPLRRLAARIRQRCPRTDESVGAPGLPQVVYALRGSANTASVTMSNATGGTEQGDVEVPFEHAFQAEAGAHLYIAAQIDESGGDLTCEITVDGVVVQTARSVGQFAIAVCSGAVP